MARAKATEVKKTNEQQPAAEWVPLASLVPWKLNPRRNKAAIPAVKASLVKFGWGRTLVARRETREVVIGHTTLAAALELGWTEGPCRFVDLSESEAHALAIADNKTAEISEWDDVKLAEVLAEVKAHDVGSLVATGFSALDLDGLVAQMAPVPSGLPDACAFGRETGDDGAERGQRGSTSSEARDPNFPLVAPQAAAPSAQDEIEEGADEEHHATPSNGTTGGDLVQIVEVSDLRAPFPWFGGKRRVGKIVWGALGNVKNYVEPFFGSGAVMLQRPGGAGAIETVNDLDAYVANFWRAVAHDPEGVAKYADWPVNEDDLHARHKWLLARNEWKKKMRDGADPEFFDAKIAGWWVWGCCAWIGSGWCADRVAPSAQVRHLSGGGQGIHGSGMTAPSEQLIQLGSQGRGEHAASLADPSEQLPMLAHGARRVLRDVLADPSEKIPQVGNQGRGVHASSLIQPSQKIPMLAHGARGVAASTITTENILAWMLALHQRLRRVRVASGDWSRVVTPAVTTGHGLTGVMLDPPYAEGADNLYGNHDKTVSAKVREWAIENGENPLLRIAFCGYEGEHEAFPKPWRVVHWKASGGYGDNGNEHRERIWLSPHCLKPGDATGFDLTDPAAPNPSLRPSPPHHPHAPAEASSR